MLKISAIIWYEANQEYIATELCEQKEVVDNKCDGNCQLAQKLQLAESSNKDSDSPKPNMQFELIHFVLPQDTSDNLSLQALTANFVPLWSFGRVIGYNSPIDHPPAA